MSRLCTAYSRGSGGACAFAKGKASLTSPRISKITTLVLDDVSGRSSSVNALAPRSMRGMLRCSTASIKTLKPSVRANSNEIGTRKTLGTAGLPCECERCACSFATGSLALITSGRMGLLPINCNTLTTKGCCISICGTTGVGCRAVPKGRALLTT